MASDVPDEAPERLSSDESLWGNQESKRKRGGPAFGVRVDDLPEKKPDDPPPPVPAMRPDPDPPDPPDPPRPRRRLLRVDLLIALAAVVPLLVGFLLGMAVTRAGSDEPPPVAETAPPAPPSTSIVVRQAPPPRECLIAMERADAAIAYLVGNIRDQRLSDTIQEFVDSRRACQAAVR
jgi:hypothetical protein